MQSEEQHLPLKQTGTTTIFYVKPPAVVLTSPTSYIVFLVDVRCAVQSCHFPFFAALCS